MPRGTNSHWCFDSKNHFRQHVNTFCWTCLINMNIRSVAFKDLLYFESRDPPFLVVVFAGCLSVFANVDVVLGLWNYVFVFSNLSLFVLLPFAYLFTESEGFFGHRKGLMGRVHETFIVLMLLAVVVLGMTYVISALIDKDKSSIQSSLSK